jgi:deazaflavin-dependent oxidoreductase (nitroreductase family)
MKLLRNEKLAYLTTIGRKSGKPHTVELWFAYASGRIFLSHEGDYTGWIKNIIQTNRVRIRIGTIDLQAEATILDEGNSQDLGKRALYEKYYGPAPKTTIDDWFELSRIIELSSVRYSA